MNRLCVSVLAVAHGLFLPACGQAQSPKGGTTLQAVRTTTTSKVMAAGGYALAQGDITRIEVRFYRDERNGKLTLMDADTLVSFKAVLSNPNAGLYLSKNFDTLPGVKYCFITTAYGKKAAGKEEVFDERIRSFVGR